MLKRGVFSEEPRRFFVKDNSMVGLGHEGLFWSMLLWCHRFYCQSSPLRNVLHGHVKQSKNENTDLTRPLTV